MLLSSTLSLAALGCAEEPTTPAADGGTDHGGDDTGTPPATSGCPGETTIAFDTDVTGTTGAGWEDDLGGWFDNSDVACDPFGTDYPAPYRVYSLPIPDHSDWDVVVTPASGVDVSLVAWTQSASDTSCYPERGIGVVACEVANASGADGEERVRVNAVNNPYHLMILVTTPPGGQAGDFTLRVADHT